MFRGSGFDILRSGHSIEKVELNGTHAFLIGEGNGSEITQYCLEKGINWYIVPAGEWKGFEYIFVLSGELKGNSTKGQFVLQPQDALSVTGVKEIIEFTAITEAKFLYFCSEPVFHNLYSNTKELIDLSVMVEVKDGYTSEHCKRIRELSLLIGHEMQLSSKEIVTLHFGSFFHDIGKAKIPDEILGKPNKFTDEEYEIMKTHARLGKEMLVASGDPVLIDASQVVEQHHERYNGMGYPNGLHADEICIGAAIVAVADSYDAMTSDRVYRKGRTHELACDEILQNRGVLYHPDVVDSFLKVIDTIRSDRR